jgi:hypothetical protein
MHKEAKSLWNEANHPDKFLELLNPCREHPSSRIFCYKDGATGQHQPWISQYFIQCNYNHDTSSIGEYHNGLNFNTPKQARDAWNELNPVEIK